MRSTGAAGRSSPKPFDSSKTGSAEIRGIGSDVATAEGCVAALEQALTALGGLDVQANNAGAVRVGRRENTDEAELQAMIDATAPILLPPAAPSAPQAAMSRWRMFALL